MMSQVKAEETQVDKGFVFPIVILFIEERKGLAD